MTATKQRASATTKRETPAQKRARMQRIAEARARIPADAPGRAMVNALLDLAELGPYHFKKLKP